MVFFHLKLKVALKILVSTEWKTLTVSVVPRPRFYARWTFEPRFYARCLILSFYVFFIPCPTSWYCLAVRPWVRFSFPDDISKTVNHIFSHCLHTSLGKYISTCCDYDLWPNFYLRFWCYSWLDGGSSVSGRYLGRCLLDCFHIAQTHPTGGCLFVGYDLLRIF